MRKGILVLRGSGLKLDHELGLLLGERTDRDYPLLLVYLLGGAVLHRRVDLADALYLGAYRRVQYQAHVAGFGALHSLEQPGYGVGQAASVGQHIGLASGAVRDGAKLISLPGRAHAPGVHADPGCGQLVGGVVGVADRQGAFLLAIGYHQHAPLVLRIGARGAQHNAQAAAQGGRPARADVLDAT